MSNKNVFFGPRFYWNTWREAFELVPIYAGNAQTSMWRVKETAVGLMTNSDMCRVFYDLMAVQDALFDEDAVKAWNKWVEENAFGDEYMVLPGSPAEAQEMQKQQASIEAPQEPPEPTACKYNGHSGLHIPDYDIDPQARPAHQTQMAEQRARYKRTTREWPVCNFGGDVNLYWDMYGRARLKCTVCK